MIAEVMWACARPGARRCLRVLSPVVLGAALLGTTGWWLGRPLPAPPLELAGIDGERLSLAAFHGRPLLVYFWAPDCAPCMREMPGLDRLYRRLSAEAGLAMIGVAVRSARPDMVLRAAERIGLAYPVALDPLGRAAAALGPVRGTPYSVLIDPDGRIVSRRLGKRDPERLERRIRRLDAEARRRRHAGRAVMDRGMQARSQGLPCVHSA